MVVSGMQVIYSCEGPHVRQLPSHSRPTLDRWLSFTNNHCLKEKKMQSQCILKVHPLKVMHLNLKVHPLKVHHLKVHPLKVHGRCGH